MSKIALALSFLFSANSFANIPLKSEPALRDQAGQIVFYSAQVHAVQACAMLEKRLPTAREYAELSVVFGSEGILESNVTNAPAHFYEVNVVNTDGTKDYFYFSDQGYVQPNDEELKGHFDACYWTASAERQVPNLFGHIFSPTFGFVRLFDRPRNFGQCAIRCVPK